MLIWGDKGRFELVFLLQNLSISSLAVVPKGTAFLIQSWGLRWARRQWRPTCLNKSAAILGSGPTEVTPRAPPPLGRRGGASCQYILKEISPKCSLMLKLKLQYFGHLMGRADSFEKSLMLGKIEGRGRRGWQRMRWLHGITDSMDMSLGKLGVGDGQGGLVCCSPLGLKESDMTERLNWTELKEITQHCNWMVTEDFYEDRTFILRLDTVKKLDMWKAKEKIPKILREKWNWTSWRVGRIQIMFIEPWRTRYKNCSLQNAR